MLSGCHCLWGAGLGLEGLSRRPQLVGCVMAFSALGWDVKAKITQLCPWNSPGQNTGVGSLSLLQGIFPTQGIKPRPPTSQVDSLPAKPAEKPWFGCD